MNKDPLFRLTFWRALAEATERISSTVVAACIVGALIGPEFQVVSGFVGGALAFGIALLSCYSKVRLEKLIADAAKEADAQ